MRFLIPAAAAASLFAVSFPSVAQEAQPSTQGQDNDRAQGTQRQGKTAQDQEQAPKSTKKICKRMPKMGSRFTEKVCLTKEQWEAERNGTQESVRKKED